jgi:hypothetical protein
MARRNEVKRMVESCLQRFPETRNSDVKLTIKIWEEYFPQRIFKSERGMPAIELYNLFDLPREDNVKRIRAKFNEFGKYLPTSWEVAKQRQIEEGVWREYIRKFPIEEVNMEAEQPVNVCPHGLPLFVSCPNCK